MRVSFQNSFLDPSVSSCSDLGSFVDHTYQSPFSRKRQISSLKEILKALHVPIVKNDKYKERLSKMYEEKRIEQIKQRRYVWNEVFMSSLDEESSQVTSEENCVQHLINSFHLSCGYGYPMEDHLIGVVHSLCRNRKQSGKISISFTELCFVSLNNYNWPDCNYIDSLFTSKQLLSQTNAFMRWFTTNTVYRINAH